MLIPKERAAFSAHFAQLCRAAQQGFMSFSTNLKFAVGKLQLCEMSDWKNASCFLLALGILKIGVLGESIHQQTKFKQSKKLMKEYLK